MLTPMEERRDLVFLECDDCLQELSAIFCPRLPPLFHWNHSSDFDANIRCFVCLVHCETLEHDTKVSWTVKSWTEESSDTILPTISHGNIWLAVVCISVFVLRDCENLVKALWL